MSANHMPQQTDKQIGADSTGVNQPRMDFEYAAAAGDRVFKTMHAFYGTLWMSKFIIGSESAGADDGVISAKRVWGLTLSRFDADVIRQALGRCMAAHPEYPPNLPQFVALCEACRPREPYRPPANAIGMSQELRSNYARRLREVNAKHLQKGRDLRGGTTARENDAGLSGLPLLNSLIAEAIGLAGGDEAAALRRQEFALLKPR